jgi:hypothetical protein
METTWANDTANRPQDAPRSAVHARAAFSGDASLSGDDAYDPASGSFFLALLRYATGGSYSGDDAYDPAAGGIPR